MKLPLISIIMPCYNSAEYITESIESVLEQTYQEFEVIVCDDCSTDKTVQVVRDLAKQDNRIQLLQMHSNQGPAAARNYALDCVRGDKIAFLDSDDLWHSNFLEEQLQFMSATKAQAVFSSYRRVGADRSSVLSDFIVPARVSYNDILKSNSIPCLTVVIDRSAVGDERMPNVGIEDLGFWLNLLKRIDFFYGNPAVLADYRLREGSRSSSKLALIKPQWDSYRKGQNLSILSSAYYLAHWAINGVLKYRK
ncbi:glycosyltransferase family 2 protein [Idiomarina sp.]|uniref:glycosyltransferase family 2 protein n=1 Tax=Idiomarina sp. TaxID=1874361 RepID=UPI003517DD82